MNNITATPLSFLCRIPNSVLRLNHIVAGIRRHQRQRRWRSRLRPTSSSAAASCSSVVLARAREPPGAARWRITIIIIIRIWRQQSRSEAAAAKLETEAVIVVLPQGHHSPPPLLEHVGMGSGSDGPHISLFFCPIRQLISPISRAI